MRKVNAQQADSTKNEDRKMKKGHFSVGVAEFRSSDDSTLTWKKSSFSNANGNCIEVAGLLGAIKVRDSLDAKGPRLSFKSGEWDIFINRVRDDQIDRTPERGNAF